MRHIIGTVFAIGLAGVAAVAATTAFLNAPLHIGPAPATTPTAATPPGQTPAPTDPAKPGTSPGDPKPANPADVPAGPGGASVPAPEGEAPPEVDKDPYEGIAPEELPPDLQYNADSSVSFPTNI